MCCWSMNLAVLKAAYKSSWDTFPNIAPTRDSTPLGRTKQIIQGKIVWLYVLATLRARRSLQARARHGAQRRYPPRRGGLSSRARGLPGAAAPPPRRPLGHLPARSESEQAGPPRRGGAGRGGAPGRRGGAAPGGAAGAGVGAPLLAKGVGAPPPRRRRRRISAPARSKPLARGLPARSRREQAGGRGGGEAAMRCGAVRCGAGRRGGAAGPRGGAAGAGGGAPLRAKGVGAPPPQLD